MTSRRDVRNPIRSLNVGAVKAEVFQDSQGLRYEFSIDKGGKIVAYGHELARVAMLAELLDRERRDGADYIAEDPAKAVSA